MAEKYDAGHCEPIKKQDVQLPSQVIPVPQKNTFTKESKQDKPK